MSSATIDGINVESTQPTITTQTTSTQLTTTGEVDRAGWPLIDSLSLVIPVYNEEGNLDAPVRAPDHLAEANRVTVRDSVY